MIIGKMRCKYAHRGGLLFLIKKREKKEEGRGRRKEGLGVGQRGGRGNSTKAERWPISNWLRQGKLSSKAFIAETGKQSLYHFRSGPDTSFFSFALF